ncbi:hypothetical protein D3C86_2067840 [compost metagenome]
MEQLQCSDIFRDIHDRRRESEGRFQTLIQLMRFNFVTDKGRQDLATAGDEIHFQHGIDVGQFELR